MLDVVKPHNFKTIYPEGLRIEFDNSGLSYILKKRLKNTSELSSLIAKVTNRLKKPVKISIVHPINKNINGYTTFKMKSPAYFNHPFLYNLPHSYNVNNLLYTISVSNIKFTNNFNGEQQLTREKFARMLEDYANTLGKGVAEKLLKSQKKIWAVYNNIRKSFTAQLDFTFRDLFKQKLDLESNVLKKEPIFIEYPYINVSFPYWVRNRDIDELKNSNFNLNINNIKYIGFDMADFNWQVLLAAYSLKTDKNDKERVILKDKYIPPDIFFHSKVRDYIKTRFEKELKSKLFYKEKVSLLIRPYILSRFSSIKNFIGLSFFETSDNLLDKERLEKDFDKFSIWFEKTILKVLENIEEITYDPSFKKMILSPQEVNEIRKNVYNHYLPIFNRYKKKLKYFWTKTPLNDNEAAAVVEFIMNKWINLPIKEKRQLIEALYFKAVHTTNSNAAVAFDFTKEKFFITEDYNFIEGVATTITVRKDFRKGVKSELNPLIAHYDFSDAYIENKFNTVYPIFNMFISSSKYDKKYPQEVKKARYYARKFLLKNGYNQLMPEFADRNRSWF